MRYFEPLMLNYTLFGHFGSIVHQEVKWCSMVYLGFS